MDIPIRLKVIPIVFPNHFCRFHHLLGLEPAVVRRSRPRVAGDREGNGLDERVHDRVHCDAGPTVHRRLWALQLGEGRVEVLTKGSDAREIRASQLREGRRAKDARGFIVRDELHRDGTMYSVAHEEGERQRVTIRTVGA